MTKLEPLADRLIVKPIPQEEVTKGGIIIPDTAKEKPQEGKVIAVGPGRMKAEGTRIPMNIKVGDRVMYMKHAGVEVTLNDEKVLIINEAEVMLKKSAPAKKSK